MYALPMGQAASGQGERSGEGVSTGSKWLPVASTILWVWAALTLAIGIAITYPVVVYGPGVPPALYVFIALALLSGVSAFGVRKQKRPFNVIAVVTGMLWILLLAAERPRVMPVGIILNAVSVATVVLNWRRFR